MVELMISSVDMANDTFFFMNITFDFKYQTSSDEDKKEEGKPFSLDAPITGTY